MTVCTFVVSMQSNQSRIWAKERWVSQFSNFFSSLISDLVFPASFFLTQFPFETKTSFQRDVETKGRQSEWDLFGGTIIRYAERFNIPVNGTKETLDKLLKDL